MTSHSTATSADGTQIAWYDYGGNGPDLLLGHASGFCAAMWGEVIDQLRSQFRCVAYDSRSHGLSSRPEYGSEGWDWERFADDAAAVIDAAKLDHPYGVGHSSGGATQLLLEERKPGTFQALYLFEPVIFADDPPRGPWPDRELAVRTRKRRASFPSPSEALETYRRKGPFATLSEGALEAYVRNGFAESSDGSVVLRCRPEDEAEVYVMASAHSGYQRLGFVQLPVAVAHGETSTSFSEAEVRHVASRLGQPTFVEFDALGHFGPLEQPDRFAAAVIDFFIA